MRLHKLRTASVLVALASVAPLPAQTLPSAQPLFTGALLGEVRNSSGVTQMGASVLLYDRYDNLVRRALSTDDGRFAFGALSPDIYTIRVSLASFLPAIRRITVAAGAESLLRVSLASVLSSIDIVPPGQQRATLMSDEWKWILRASQAARPVLRFRDPRLAPKESAGLFSDFTGVVSISGGDSSLLNNGFQQDMGTAFALEGSMTHGSKMRVAANVGYAASSGLPTAALRTTYERERNGAAGPQVSLTVRQAFFPAPIGGASAPAFRAASLSTMDSIELADGLRLEYGSSLDSIMLYGRIAYVSPFARATYDLGSGGVMSVAFSNGFNPAELVGRQRTGETDLSQDLAALGQAPKISRRDDHAAVERTKAYEASYRLVDGKRTFTVVAFREQTSNAVFLMSGDIALAGAANLLPDLNTRGTVFNVGDFQRVGFSAGLAEAVSDLLEISVEGGRAGALVADGPAGRGPLRRQIQQEQRPWLTARLNASAPLTGTKLGASYGWTDFRALMPVHQSLTGRTGQQVGWNVSARQPLPGMGGMRMEVMAEIRNLLAQGYLGLKGADGRRAELTNAPRQLRGGVSFIF